MFYSFKENNQTLFSKLQVKDNDPKMMRLTVTVDSIPVIEATMIGKWLVAAQYRCIFQFLIDSGIDPECIRAKAEYLVANCWMEWTYRDDNLALHSIDDLAFGFDGENR